jgi:hypothetical protein
VREVSDSLHLRRLCLLPLTQRVPDESTVRKLVRRLGPEVVAELSRAVIGKARRETRFAARAVRIDSTVVEADIRYPSDGMLALQGAGGPPAGCSAAQPECAGGGSFPAEWMAGSCLARPSRPLPGWRRRARSSLGVPSPVPGALAGGWRTTAPAARGASAASSAAMGCAAAS